jgi:hypothetical protein
MKTIPLTLGKVAIVDDEDYNELIKYKWYGNGNGTGDIIYAKRLARESDNRNEKIISMHRQIMEFPVNKNIDHINHNGIDNRRCNLRICTQTQNMFNRRRKLRSKSGLIGVSWFKKLKKWRATIHMTIGYFDSKEEAGKAYDEVAKKLFGEFANLNYSEKEGDVNE